MKQHFRPSDFYKNKNLGDGALTLFIKNMYAFEYIIVFCDVL